MTHGPGSGLARPGGCRGSPLPPPLPNSSRLTLPHPLVRQIARAPKSGAWLVITTARARGSRSPLGEGGQADYLSWIRGEGGMSAYTRCARVRVERVREGFR